jgi:hypothetical protein
MVDWVRIRMVAKRELFMAGLLVTSSDMRYNAATLPDGHEICNDGA